MAIVVHKRSWREMIEGKFRIFDKERKKEQKIKKAERLVETAATDGNPLEEHADSHSRLDKPSKKRARLIHSYHKPDGG